MDHRLRRFVFQAARPLLSRVYAGVASIVMFHNVVDDPPDERAGWVPDCEVSCETLACLVERLRRRGHEFVGLDELCEALGHPPHGRGKLVAVTFDDGYASVYRKALPLLEALRVPFTLYLVTSAPEGTYVPWWYLLERRVVSELPAAERSEGFRRRAALFEKAPPAALPGLIERTFDAREAARAGVETWLSWDEVEALARHPLVTIGSHTVRHPRLAGLPREEARWEMCESRRVLEARLHQRVHHFAYPFGSQRHVGPREYELARECGYRTAVTTRLANLFPEHARHLEALPRIFGRTLADIELGVSGAVSAFLYRGRQVISA